MTDIKNTTTPICTGCPYQANHENVWLDNQDIMIRMHISSRTLQTWRSSGILPYLKIGKKIYYRESDLNRMMKP